MSSYLVLAGYARAETKWYRPDLDGLLQALVDSGAPGAAAEVWSGDRVWRGSAGVADLGVRRKPDFQDAWQIASLTKMFTATTLVLLRRAGKIDLSRPAVFYLPALSGVLDRKITVLDLLRQTSGLQDYMSDPGFPYAGTHAQLLARLDEVGSSEVYVERAIRRGLRFRPGERHDYSNTNYLLLGMIIEVVSGQSFESEVRSKVLDPLQLTGTGFPSGNGELPVAHWKEYLPGDTPVRRFTDYGSLSDVTVNRFFGVGDQGMYSTFRDIRRFLMALMLDPFLSIEERKLMLDVVADEEEEYSYGLGVMSYEAACNVVLFGHEGRGLGAATQAFVTADGKTSAVIMTNAFIDDSESLTDAVYKLQNAAFCVV